MRNWQSHFEGTNSKFWGLVSCVLLSLSVQVLLEQPASGSLDHPASVVEAPRYSAKKIEDVEIGDYVLARDEETGQLASRPVTQVFRRTSDHVRKLTIQSVASGEIQQIETTDEHPFWVSDLGWVNAKNLRPQDELTDADGGAVIVLESRYEARDEGVPVFNFEVADLHTYYVRSGDTRGPPVLVHNTCDFDEFGQPLINGKPLVQLDIGGPRRGANALPIVGNSFVPDTTKVVEKLTNRAIADLAANPGLARDLMSSGSYRHLVQRTNLAGASYGKAVERLVARYIREDELLSAILTHTGLTRGANGRFISTPDFIGKEPYNLRLLDITTEADLAKHLRRLRGPSTDHITYPGLPHNLEFPR